VLLGEGFGGASRAGEVTLGDEDGGCVCAPAGLVTCDAVAEYLGRVLVRLGDWGEVWLKKAPGLVGKCYVLS
jgi:hypothetical protein